MAPPPILSPFERRFLHEVRRAVLATIDQQGQPRLVPICHVVGERDDPLGRPILYTPVDEKPKLGSDPAELARIRDLLVRPEASVLADAWSEDWTRLGWLRVYGCGEILQPPDGEGEEHARAVTGLRAKYPQYAGHRLEARPIIRLTIERARSWGHLAG